MQAHKHILIFYYQLVMHGPIHRLLSETSVISREEGLPAWSVHRAFDPAILTLGMFLLCAVQCFSQKCADFDEKICPEQIY